MPSQITVRSRASAWRIRNGPRIASNNVTITTTSTNCTEPEQKPG